MESNKQFDLTTFQKAYADMIAKNDSAWNDNRSYFWNRKRHYTLEDVDKILEEGTIEEQQQLSRYYFDRDGFYKRIILYYATLLTYSGLLIPNPSFGKQLSKPYISKRYYLALDYLDKINIPEVLTRMSIKVLIYGSYYGMLQTLDENSFVLIDLPNSYCRSRFVDLEGNDIIEFNVQYFDTILDQDDRQEALNVYPKEVRSYYRKYKKGKTTTPWTCIPIGIGFCFSFFDTDRPLMLNIIPATIQYDDAVDTERERELEEIRKIIVQKIPHLQDGALLFEPEEALEMHRGAVDMMKGNKNLSILTTYADVEAIISRTSADNVSTNLEKMVQNIYSQGGASAQLFAPTGSQALPTSITNDMSLMMILGNKYSRFLSYILNRLFANANVNFKYMILPLSLYNKSDFISDSLRLAQSGYSYLLPGIASGLSQRELISIKDLENEELSMRDKLIPLSTSYTQSENNVGAPEKKLEDKSDKTIQNENAIDNQGGSE